MRLVTRYILREHIGPLVFSVTTLTSLLLLNYISKRLADLVGKGLPWTVIGEFFVLSIPFTVAMTLPMAVLISTLYAFSRLAADSEITALMASGMGSRQLMMPVLGVGVALSLLMVGFNDQVLPAANFRLSNLMGRIHQKKPTLALQEQRLNQVSSRGLFMWVSHLDEKRNTMRDVTIYDLAEAQVRHTIVADSAELAFAPNERDLLMTLYDGYVQETNNTTPNRFERTFFKKNVMRVADVANQLVLDDPGGGFKGDREMTVCEMQAEIRRSQRTRDSMIKAIAATEPETAAAYAKRFGNRSGEWYCSGTGFLFTVPTAGAQNPPAAQIPARLQGGTATVQGSPPPGVQGSAQPGGRARPVQTEAMMQTVASSERRIASYEVEIQKKFALSFACLVFALLGPPIALRFPRSGVGLTIGVSLVVFSIYYIGLIAGEALGNNLRVSPVIAMWAANVILGTLGLVLALRMGKQGANARGGGMQAFFDRIGELLHLRRSL